MRNTFKKTTLSLALATGLIGSAAWSTAAQACAAEPLVSSICVMAAVSLNGDFGGGVFAVADGRLLPISQNAALYSLIGQTYGGSGQVSFAIPDLRGRVVMGSGRGPGLPLFSAGQMYGQLTTNLTVAQLPMHNHTLSTVAVNTSKMTATTTLSGLSASLTGTATLKASSGGTSSNDPTGKALTSTSGTAARIYSDAAPSISMNASGIDVSGLAVGNFTGSASTSLGGTATLAGATDVTGASDSVSLMQPSLVLNYYIAVNGIYPTRN
ncbi:MAG: tail fiber protein [Gallionella sp.]|jgi:microcystin-dependent protein|nr:tail fiber protein [Gallionella sp.]MCK9353946.1 tail fiber protein [Gallionella sp.]